MAATDGTILGPYLTNTGTFGGAFTNPSNLDVLQIVNEGGEVVWNLSHTGVASTDPASPTGEALIGRYAGSNVATAFKNASNLDLLQIYSSTGDSLIFHVDYLGTAHTP
jgi:hypothetical protein